MKKILTFTIIAIIALIVLSTNVNAADLSEKIEVTDGLNGIIKYSVQYDETKNVNKLVATLNLSEKNIDTILNQKPGNEGWLSLYVFTLNPNIESLDGYAKEYVDYGAECDEKTLDEALAVLSTKLDNTTKVSYQTIWPTLFTIEYNDGNGWKLPNKHGDGSTTVKQNLMDFLNISNDNELVYGKNYRINAYNNRSSLWGWKTINSSGAEYNYVAIETKIEFPVSGVTNGGRRQTFFKSLEQALEASDIKEVIINEDLTIDKNITVPENVTVTVAEGATVKVLPNVEFVNNGTVNGDVEIYYNVNINTPVNGTITVNKSEAQEGEEVTVTLTPNEGYMLRSVSMSYSWAKQESYEEVFKFIMPDENVDVAAVFEEIKDVILEVEVPDEVKNKKEAKKIILESLKEYIEGNNYYRNKDLKVKLEIEEIPSQVSGTMPEEMWEGFKGALKDKDATAKMTSKFIETIINIIDTDNGTMENSFMEILKPITLNIDLPEGLSEVAEGYERVYYIVRCYESDYEMCYDAIEAKLLEDGKTIEFSTDKLGVFNVAYNDVKKVVEDEKNGNTENNTANNTTNNVENNNVNTTTNNEEVPQTGDNIVIYAILAVVAIAGMVVTIKVRKRK